MKKTMKDKLKDAAWAVFVIVVIFVLAAILITAWSDDSLIRR